VDVAPRLVPQQLPERLVGDRIAGADARGKHHLLRFESGRVLHSHLMMNGRWRLIPAERSAPRAALWIAITTDLWVAALYHGPVLRLLEAHERVAMMDELGPDLLGADVDPGVATERALLRCDPTIEVGDALMNQRLVSGIGNVYKSETCFLAGVDPWRTVGTLSPEEARALGEIGGRLLAEGVRQPGRIQTYRAPGARPSSREDRWVYGRRGKPCRRCGEVIKSRGQGDSNRTTYWCPTCQQ
jgi:endonuclease VIII